MLFALYSSVFRFGNKSEMEFVLFVLPGIKLAEKRQNARIWPISLLQHSPHTHTKRTERTETRDCWRSSVEIVACFVFVGTADSRSSLSISDMAQPAISIYIHKNISHRWARHVDTSTRNHTRNLWLLCEIVRARTYMNTERCCCCCCLFLG